MSHSHFAAAATLSAPLFATLRRFRRFRLRFHFTPLAADIDDFRFQLFADAITAFAFAATLIFDFRLTLPLFAAFTLLSPCLIIDAAARAQRRDKHAIIVSFRHFH